MNRLFLLALLLVSSVSWGAFAVVESVTPTTNIVASTDKVIDYPAVVDPGDLLLIGVSNEGVITGSFSTPAGLTKIDEDINISSGGGSSVLFCLSAVGDEDGTTVTTSTTQSDEYAAQVIRITAWGGSCATDVDVSAVPVETTAATIDIPSVTAGGGSADNLFIEWAFFQDDAETLDSCSTSYGNLVSTVANNSSNASASIGTCRREFASASDDPAGTMGVSATATIRGINVVIAPAGGASTTPLRRRR